MSADHHLSFERRPAGVSSRLHAGGGPRSRWRADNGMWVELPVVLDLVDLDESSGRPRWWVAATVAAPNGVPAVVHMSFGAEKGLDLMRLQREFRWQTPLDVVTRIVPRLQARGEDPFAYEYPITGYPEASLSSTTEGRHLSEDFLEDIAREYLQLGRGYIRQMARTHHVSERTITSWVHKARQRGILTSTRRGVKGGELVERESRSGVGDRSG